MDDIDFLALVEKVNIVVVDKDMKEKLSINVAWFYKMHFLKYYFIQGVQKK